MSKYYKSEFQIQAQLREFILKQNHQIKAIKVISNQQEYIIKLSQKIEKSFVKKIKIGSHLRIKGTKKVSHKNNQVKLKAQNIELIKDKDDEKISTITPKKSGTILICNKSKCWKNGGQAICHLLTENLRQHGLENSVNIKTTGCIKRCKQGPNLVFMPQKTHYEKVQPQQIPSLLTQNQLV